MRVERAAAIVYACLAVAYGVVAVSENVRIGEDVGRVLFIGVIVLQPIAGFLIPRFWALGLPFIAPVVALAFSEPDPGGGRLGILLMFMASFVGMVLLAFGIGCRLTLDMLREPR